MQGSDIGVISNFKGRLSPFYYIFVYICTVKIILYLLAIDVYALARNIGNSKQFIAYIYTQEVIHT